MPEEQRVLPGKAGDLIEWIWPLVWGKKETLQLRDSRGRTFYFKRGDRVIYLKQLEAILSIFQFKVTLLAGGTGGGKSIAMMWGFIVWLITIGERGFPKAKGIMLAESMDTIMSRQHGLLDDHLPKWLGHKYGGNGTVPYQYILEDEYYGGRIEYRSTDKFDMKLKGMEAAIWGIEESTNQPEALIDTLITRARWSHNGIPLEHVPIFMVTNPKGTGVAWHKKRFVNPWDPVSRTGRKPPMWVKDVRGNTRWFRGYNLIESYPMDNPSLSDDYVQGLSMMEGQQKKVYLLGLWEDSESSFFKLEPKAHLFPVYQEMPLHWNRFIAIDYAMNHTGAVYAGAMDEQGTLWVRWGFEAKGLTPIQFKERMADTFVEADGSPMRFVLQVADPSMFPPKNGPAARESCAMVLNTPDEFGQFNFWPAFNSRILGWQGLQSMLAFDAVETIDEKTFDRNVTITRMPRLRICENLTHLYASLQLVERDPKNSEDCLKTNGDYGPGMGDDGADTLRYLTQAAFFNRFTTPDQEGRRGKRVKFERIRSWG